MSLLYAWLAVSRDAAHGGRAGRRARRSPRSELRSRVTHLERGLSVDRDALVDVLVQAGYQRTSLVEERGEVGARGGIIDLFPPQLDRPVRIEFDFDAIGSLRRFDPTTQRSEGELDAVVAIPPRAYRLPNDIEGLVQEVRRRGREQGLPSRRSTPSPRRSRRALPPGVRNLAGAAPRRRRDDLRLPAAGDARADRRSRRGPRARARTSARSSRATSTHARQDRLVCDPLCCT
jgi:transcription-repair coupling factor (superfamily II helicase)